MSKAVLVMDTPESCSCCKFLDEENACIAADTSSVEDVENKPDWCPLVPVPEDLETVMDKEIKWLSWEKGKEWGKIQCPMLGDEMVMTYYPEGAPCYYSYTAPFVQDGEVCYYRFDHDEGCWDEDTLFCMGEYEEGIVIKFD